jgi:hypothetical protein
MINSHLATRKIFNIQESDRSMGYVAARMWDILKRRADSTMEPDFYLTPLSMIDGIARTYAITCSHAHHFTSAL